MYSKSLERFEKAVAQRAAQLGFKVNSQLLLNEAPHPVVMLELKYELGDSHDSKAALKNLSLAIRYLAAETDTVVTLLRPDLVDNDGFARASIVLESIENLRNSAALGILDKYSQELQRQIEAVVNKTGQSAKRVKRTPGEKTVKKSVSFPPDLAAELQAAADAKGVSFGKHILDLLSERDDEVDPNYSPEP